MRNRFRSYDLAVAFYQDCKHIKLPGYVKNQLMRASLSICLNLREGRGRRTLADQLKFFQIALGSTRECQGIAELHQEVFSEKTNIILDQLAASVYLLTKRAR